MPQEFHVLRCFACETYQVHIVKKTNKWQCKMCGEKQSVKRNYGKGSGKDCRNQVMKLNEQRLSKNEKIYEGNNESLNDTFINASSENSTKTEEEKIILCDSFEVDEQEELNKSDNCDLEFFIELTGRNEVRNDTNDFSKKRNREIYSNDENVTNDFFSELTGRKLEKINEDVFQNKRFCEDLNEQRDQINQNSYPIYSNTKSNIGSDSKTALNSHNICTRTNKYAKYLEDEE